MFEQKRIVRNMQNKKQATKQMGCEGKKTITFYSNF